MRASASAVASLRDQASRAHELRGLESLCDVLFEHSAECVLLTRLDGTILRANPAACRAYGLSEAEVCRRGRTRHVVDDAALRAFIAKRARTGVATGELTGIRGDGTRFPVEVTSAIVLARGGEDYAQVIFRDISERKEAERAQERLAAIVQGTDDAIISKDLEGNIQTWNAAAERLFGYSAEEAIGRSIKMLLPPDRQHEQDEILRRLRAGQQLDHFETKRVTKLGTIVDVSVSASPLRDARGVVVGASKIARDITRQKRAEDALRASLQENEKLVAELREALQNVKTLSGLLSACAWCHKIRDDSGRWEKLETYVSRRSDAKFTHGICPECFDKHEHSGHE